MVLPSVVVHLILLVEVPLTVGTLVFSDSHVHVIHVVENVGLQPEGHAAKITGELLGLAGLRLNEMFFFVVLQSNLRRQNLLACGTWVALFEFGCCVAVQVLNMQVQVLFGFKPKRSVSVI